jgi:hypothetical protein
MWKEQGCLLFRLQPCAILAIVSESRAHLEIPPCYLIRKDFFAAIFLPFFSFFAMGFSPSNNVAPLGRPAVICKLPSNVHDELAAVQVALFEDDSISSSPAGH